MAHYDSSPVLSCRLERSLGIHDTCGVHNLHGLPALLSALCSAVVIGYSGARDTYTAATSAETFESVYGGLPPGQRGQMQACYQLASLAVCLGMAVGSGLICGALVSLYLPISPYSEYNIPRSPYISLHLPRSPYMTSSPYSTEPHLYLTYISPQVRLIGSPRDEELFLDRSYWQVSRFPVDPSHDGPDLERVRNSRCSACNLNLSYICPGAQSRDALLLRRARRDQPRDRPC